MENKECNCGGIKGEEWSHERWCNSMKNNVHIDTKIRKDSVSERSNDKSFILSDYVCLIKSFGKQYNGKVIDLENIKEFIRLVKEEKHYIDNPRLWFESLSCMQREELFPDFNFVETHPSNEQIVIAHRCFWIGKRCKNTRIDKFAGNLRK